MNYVIKIADHPEAVPHLAALYAATQKDAATGRTGRTDREKLAAIVGGEVATVLRTPSTPIRVNPKGVYSWVVVDEAGDSKVDYALARILKEEMRKQGLTERKLADLSGLKQQTVNAIVRADNCPSWINVRKMLKGLGKDLAWLAKAIEGKE